MRRLHGDVRKKGHRVLEPQARRDLGFLVMPTDRLHPRAGEPDMSADQIAGRRFAQSWRGYDPEEVRQFLGQVAAQVRALRERAEAESSARREAEQRGAHPHIDEATLMLAVGEETAAILRSARSAAAEITAKAEVKAHQSVSSAEAKAAELLANAEALLAVRSSEAEAVAAGIQANAEAEAEELRQEAQRQAALLAEQAAQEHRETVEGAQAIREGSHRPGKAKEARHGPDRAAQSGTGEAS